MAREGGGGQGHPSLVIPLTCQTILPRSIQHPIDLLLLLLLVLLVLLVLPDPCQHQQECRRDLHCGDPGIL